MMFAKLKIVLPLCFFTVARTCALDTSSIKIEKVAEPGELSEGPHWDVESQKLYYVDIDGQKIFRLDPATGKRTYAYLKGGPVGVAVPVEGTKDKLIAGVGRDVVLVTWDGESNNDNPPTEKLASLDTDRNDTRVNDGKCDSSGRFWIGTLGLNGSNRGALYLVSKDGKVKKVLSPVSNSNGLIWSLENDVMYHIDSPTLQISAYSYSNTDGSITNKRVVFDFNKNNLTKGGPDGMTNDADGNLWIAAYGEKAVLQVDPKSGKLLRKVELPVERITSVAFGGPELDILYVTSAKDSVASDSGAVFSIKGLGVKGRPPYEYKYLVQ